MLALFSPVLGLLVAASTPALPPAYQTAVEIVGDTVPVADRAKELIRQIQDGKVDRSLLTPAFDRDFTAGAVAADASFLAGRGKPTRFALLRRSDTGDDVRYVFLAGWNDGAVNMTFGIDKKTDLVDALYFRAAGND